MKFPPFLLFVALINFNSVFAQNLIKQYTPAVYNAGANINYIYKSGKGLMYFCSDEGLIEYDGNSWTAINTKFKDVTVIKESPEGTLYVGMNNDFGFLEADSTGATTFYSLTDEIRKNYNNLGEPWKIHFIDGKTYFQSYEDIFVYDGTELSAIHLKNSNVFRIKDKLYGSTWDTHKFGPIQGDSILSVRNHEILNGLKDAIYEVFNLDDSTYLLASYRSGIFKYDLETNTVFKFDSPASDFIKTYRFHDGIQINDNIITLGTWDGGIIFIDNFGNILSQLDRNNGLFTNRVYHMAVGNSDDLWIGTNAGIGLVKLDSLNLSIQPSEGLPIQAVIRKVLLNGNQPIHDDHVSHNLACSCDVEFSDTPNSLSFQYTCPAFIGEEIEYSVILEGYDKEWSSWQKDYKTEYKKIENGDYSFRVKARNLAGQISDEDSLSFRVSIPLYNTDFIYVLTATLGVIVLLVLIKLQINYLRRLVKDRTRDIKVLLDQSEKKHQQLIEQEKQIKKTNEELRSVIYSLSHDLKSPLRAIGILSDLISIDFADKIGADGKKHLNTMGNRVRRMDNLIAGILNYYKAGNSENDETVVDLNIVVSDIISVLHNPDIEIIIDNELPSVFTQRLPLKQLIEILIDNSVKFMDKEFGQINIGCYKAENMWQIYVKDNGPGIAKKNHSSIFKIFQTVNAKDKIESTGIGLSIAGKIVQSFGGSIWVESELGESTTIYFTISDDSFSKKKDNVMEATTSVLL